MNESKKYVMHCPSCGERHSMVVRLRAGQSITVHCLCTKSYKATIQQHGSVDTERLDQSHRRVS